MTRFDEIMNAANEIKATIERHGANLNVDDFRIGAKWADEHPVNQWKDINKEQPPTDELPFLISYDDYGDFVGKETCFWSECAYRLCSDGRSFEELEPWYHITHWMPIPELPEKKRS